MYKPNLNTMKKIFGLVAVAAIAALNVVVSNNNKEELSDLTLENIEACADVPGEFWGPMTYRETIYRSTYKMVKVKQCTGGKRYDPVCTIVAVGENGSRVTIEGRGSYQESTTYYSYLSYY